MGDEGNLLLGESGKVGVEKTPGKKGRPGADCGGLGLGVRHDAMGHGEPLRILEQGSGFNRLAGGKTHSTPG